MLHAGESVVQVSFMQSEAGSREHDEPREIRRDYGYGYSGHCRGISRLCGMS